MDNKYSRYWLVQALTITNYIFIGICAFCAIAILIITIEACGSYHLRIDIQGIDTMLDFWRGYEPLFSTIGKCLTLLIINSNLLRYIDVETVKLLGDLRGRLQSEAKKNIHNYLLKETDKKPILNDLNLEDNPNIEIFDYLGTLELGAIMLSRNVITQREFDNQFGYRIKNVRDNQELQNHIEKEKDHYAYLYQLVNK